MGASQWISRLAATALLVAGVAAGPLAQPRPPEGPVTIQLATLSQHGSITPKSGARLSDADGLPLTDGEAVITAFSLRAVIGDDTVEISVPELQVGQLVWIADPVGCADADPKTKCRPTWGAEYSGRVPVDVPVHVEFGGGGVAYSDYGVVDLLLNVTVVDNRVRRIEGAVQVSYSTVTNLPNYRIPIVGKLK